MHLNSKLLTRAVCAAVLVATAACGDNISPRRAALQPAHFTPTILDGAHGGNQSVFFLPPMVSNPQGQPGYGDPVAAGLPVSFKINQLLSTGCAAQLTKVFTTADVTFDGTQYQANWNTNDSNLNASCTYRISVIVGSQIEAFADVDVVSSGGQLKRVDTQEYVPLLDGRTLPIKVRVEQGVKFCNDANCASQIVPANATTLVSTPDGENAVLFTPGWFDASALGTDQVIVSVDDITSSSETSKTGCGLGVTKMVTPSTAGAPVHCVRFTTDPHVTHTTAPVTAAVCLENPNNIPQLLLKYDVNEAPVFLRNVQPPIVCPEQGGGIGSTSTFGGVVRYALSRVGHAVQSIFGPRTAYAFDLGAGGAFDGSGFSVIAAGTPVQMVAASDTLPSATAGDQVDGSQTIQLRYLHRPSENTPVGPNDANVTCTVVGTNGHLTVGDANANSGAAIHSEGDADGIYRCPSWTLDQGDNFLQVTAATLDGVITLNGVGTFRGTVTFHGTGTPPIVIQ
ncbi:MAG TPA: hypothetical protein VGJ18_19520 [Gemmatimonadaceae bacterium]|jgi:hypothetical protein